ncbi:hypothetical protein RQP46_003849 [Phenoliferia psychrophenolica]
MAGAQSAKASVEAAEKERARLAAAKEALIAKEKKEIAERKGIEERRREREARERQRVEEERMRQLELPKTRNAYSLKKEREKRGLDPSGKDDPPKAPKASTSKSPKISSSKPRAAPRDNGPMTWEEKKAKKRDALFKETNDDATTGGMALARAQLKSEGGSRPSSASARPPGAARPASAPDSPRTTTTLGVKAKHLGKAPAGRSSKPNPSAASTARDRLKAGFNPREFVALNAEKRDRRTIEEIERDMRLKKGGSGRDDDDDRPSSSSRALPSASSSRLPPPGKSATGDRLAATSSSKAKRPQDRSDSDDSGSDSDDSDSDRRRRRKRKAGKDRNDSGLGDASREEIWRLFGRDRRADVGRDRYSDESDDDMEVSGEALRREEAKAARLAAKEDEEEQERLRQHAEKKKLLKQQAGAK